MKNKRKFSAKITRAVYERDGVRCVIPECQTPYYLERQPHHAWYGGEAQYDDGRNNEDRLVTICRNCHHDIHFSGSEEGKKKREFCKEYLLKIYQ